MLIGFHVVRCERATPSNLDAMSVSMYLGRDHVVIDAAVQVSRQLTGLLTWLRLVTQNAT
jgi:orotidine-5'-phosphate decarboxylase